MPDAYTSPNRFYFVQGGNKYQTTLCPEEIGGEDSYIEQREGWMPTVARCFMSDTQFEALPDGVQLGTTPVAVVIHGQSNAPNALGAWTGDMYASPATDAPKTTAEIFYLWKSIVHRKGTSGDLLEVEFRTQQQWWDAISIWQDYNPLAADKALILGPSGPDGLQLGPIITDIFTTQAGITQTLDVSRITGLSYRPLDLRLRNVPFTVALRRILDPMRLVMTHDIYTNKFTVEFAKSIDVDAESAAWNPYLLNGDAYGNPSGDIIPANIQPTFPKDLMGFDFTAPNVPPTSPITATGPATAANLPWHIGDHFDIPGTVDQGLLATVKTNLAKAWYQNAAIQPARWKLTGNLWPQAGTTSVPYMLPGFRVRRVSTSVYELFTTIEQGPQRYDLATPPYYSNALGYRIVQRIRPEGAIDTQSTAFWAKLTGATKLTNLAWAYNWKMVRRISTGFQDITTPITDASPGYKTVISSMEFKNVANLTAGTGFLPMGAPLPLAPGTLQPLGITTGQEAYVLIEIDEDENGDPAFCIANLPSTISC